MRDIRIYVMGDDHDFMRFSQAEIGTLRICADNRAAERRLAELPRLLHNPRNVKPPFVLDHIDARFGVLGDVVSLLRCCRV